MKTVRKLIALLTILASLMASLSACDSVSRNEKPAKQPEAEPANSYAVSYCDTDGTVLFTDVISSPESFAEIPMENRTVNGREQEFFRWEVAIEENEKIITATATYLDVLPKSDSAYHYEILGDYFSPEEKNNILVVFVSFTDGYQIEHDAFEALFTAEYAPFESMRSVASYFKTVSYGRDLLDFTFAYYDCDMTSEEAWHYVNDEDSKGNFVGNDFFFDIFREMQKSGSIDTTKLDSDGDGYVDASVFVFGETPVNGCVIYGGAAGHTARWQNFIPDPDNPTLGQYVKLPYSSISEPLNPGVADHQNTRVPIHEVGHLFGVSDYYDFYWYDDGLITGLGGFDMQEENLGDWNTFSKFACGWLHPYVITPDIESVTLRLRCSATHDEAILIPTSLGWNGSAFDEYLLVDVLAPEGPSGFDWSFFTYDDNRSSAKTPANKDGGVRILHVDARLMQRNKDESWTRVNDPGEIANIEDANLAYAYYNTNGIEPKFEGDSRYYHLIEYVPCDGTQKIRVRTPTSYSIYTAPCSRDLFGAGAVFSPETHAGAFTNGVYMNNGGTIDYTITVEEYDPVTHEAIVTITRRN